MGIVLLGLGLLASIGFHACVMFGIIGLEQKYILFINLGLVLALGPMLALSKKLSEGVVVERAFKTAIKVFPWWLKIGLGSILAYAVIIFIYFMYINSPLAERPDVSAVLVKMNKGASAATIFFYAAQFGMLNLYLRVKRIRKCLHLDPTTEHDQVNE